jgi:hypothetical protein
MEVTKLDKQMNDTNLMGQQKSNHSEEMMQESMVNVMEQSSFKLATNTNEIEVTNLTKGKENAPLNKQSVGL